MRSCSSGNSLRPEVKCHVKLLVQDVVGQSFTDVCTDLVASSMDLIFSVCGETMTNSPRRSV
jgi:hypothetical protein